MPFLNLTEPEIDRAVYRIMRCEHFLSMLDSQQNLLVHPREWDDPFENVILNSRGRLPSGETVGFAFRDGVFAQCWSRHKETDLMWRGYSPHKQGVKVRVTIRALHDSLCAASGEFRDINVFIGRVRYLKRSDFREAVRRAHVLDGSGRGIAQTLLLKRYGFWPEGEVRLIYTYPGSTTAPLRHVYAFDVNATVTDAVLDPRMPEAEAKEWKRRFRSAGFENTLIQSGLYKGPPPYVIDL